MKERQGFGVLGGQIPRLYGGTIFGGVRHTWGIQRGIERKSSRGFLGGLSLHLNHLIP